MSQKTETTTIDGVEYTTTQFSAMHSFGVLAELVKVAGPAIAVLTTAEQGQEITQLAPALMGALGGLDPEVAKNLVLKLLAMTYAIVDDKKVDFTNQKAIDRVFTGNLKALFQVVGHAISVNYSDFFAGSASSTPTVAYSLGE